MCSQLFLISCALLVARGACSFDLFAFYEQDYIASFYGLSGGCISALNTTIDCDQNTAALVGQGADSNYWYMDNITALCTQSCGSSLSSWLTSVEEACEADNVTTSSVQVQAKAMALQFTFNYDLACLQDSEDDWCFFESQNWQGSDYIRYDSEYCLYDPIPPECTDENSTFSVTDISPDMSAMTSLYPSTFYCSECFLELFRQRLLDPWLVQSNFTDYLIGQFDDVQANCSTSLPYTTSASTLYLASVTSTATATATVTASNSATTCTGQLLDPLESPLICNDLSDAYNITTGDARVATNDYYCQFNTTICIPLPCDIDTIQDVTTCGNLATLYSNSTYNITQAQLFSWNQNVQGSCDDLAIGQRVCKAAPGGTYPSPTASIYAPTATNAYYTTASPSVPTQSGSIADCGNYYQVVAGDDCNGVCLRFGINLTTLQTFNTYLNDACTNLWLNYDICVAEVTPSKDSTDGTCGPGLTCDGTAFGPCCSTSGFCGSDDSYCDAGNCQSGACITGNSLATTNGTCGPSVGGLQCTNANFGPCCSIYGYCGNGTDFCGAGNCYSGQCDTDNGGPSTNGECGPNFAGNKTCTGTQFGSCCSTSGYCGSTSDYCAGSGCYSGACTT